MKSANYAVHRLKLDASEIATLLEEMASRLMVIGVSKFKVRAYENAARNLRSSIHSLSDLIAQDEVTSIPGVGSALAEKIITFAKTGTLPALEKLRNEVPDAVVDFARIPAIGARRAMKLYRDLNIKDLSELRSACAKNELASAKGFGKSIQKRICENLEPVTIQTNVARLNRTTYQAEALVESIRVAYPEAKQIVICGDVRRGCELCRPTVIAISGTKAFLHRLGQKNLPGIVYGSEDVFGAVVLFATGSDLHTQQLKELSQTIGLALTPRGLFKGKKLLPSESEEQIYSALGLRFIPPELREGIAEISWAQMGNLPKLVQESDLQGTFHCHTEFSDGKNTVKEMADAAIERQLQYLGISDHSQAAYYAKGLKFPKVLEQQGVIERLNKTYGNTFKIFKGIESDILRDGRLDYTPKELASFDFVVASIHNRHQLSRDEQTARVLKAVQNPFTTFLGHPTGRILQRRKEYDGDIHAILKACAEYGVIVEINGDPHRMDLDWRLHQQALKYGCQFSLNPDAHDTQALSYLKWSTCLARKGGLAPGSIFNCRPLDQVEHYLTKRKTSAMRR